MSDVPETHNDEIIKEATLVPNHPSVSKVSLRNVETKELKQLYNIRALSKTATTYELENFKKNILLIFNHETFDTGHSPRKGTVNDVKALTKSFKNVGFEVVPYSDLKKKEIFDKLEDFSKTDFTDYGCIAIAVLTHGDKGILRAKDSSYNEQEIWNHFKIHENRTLVTKPRILIVQACRGDEISEAALVKPGNNKIIEKDGNEKEEEPYHIPEEADILATHSSFYGYPSFRENPDGTWFIQTLCKKLDALAPTHDFESILTEVKKEVAIVNKYEEYNSVKIKFVTQKQMPVSTTTLTRKLYLRKYVDGTLNKTNTMIVEPIPNIGFFENDSQKLKLVINSLLDLHQQSSTKDNTVQEVNYLSLSKWIFNTVSLQSGSGELSENDIKRIDEALQEFGPLLDNMHAIRQAEDKFSLMGPVATDINTIKSQLTELASYTEEVISKIQALNRQVANTSQHLPKMNSRLSALLQSVKERKQLLETTLKCEQQKQALKDLLSWIQNASQTLDRMIPIMTFPHAVKTTEMLKLEQSELKVLVNDISAHQADVEDFNKTSGKAVTNEEVAILNKNWNELQKKTEDRQAELENGLSDAQRQYELREAHLNFPLREEFSRLFDELRNQERLIDIDAPVHGDLRTVRALLHDIKIVTNVCRLQIQDMQSLFDRARNLELQQTEVEIINQQISQVEQEWDTVNSLLKRKTDKLTNALDEAAELSEAVQKFYKSMFEAEMKVQSLLPDSKQETQRQIQEHEEFIRDLKEIQRDKDNIISLAQSILSKAHPNAVAVIKLCITDVENRCSQVWQWAMQRRDKLETLMQKFKDIDKAQHLISDFEEKLILQSKQPIPQTVEEIERQIIEHDELVKNMQERDNEINMLCEVKNRRRDSISTIYTPENLLTKSVNGSTLSRVPRSQPTPIPVHNSRLRHAHRELNRYALSNPEASCSALTPSPRVRCQTPSFHTSLYNLDKITQATDPSITSDNSIEGKHREETCMHQGRNSGQRFHEKERTHLQVLELGREYKHHLYIGQTKRLQDDDQDQSRGHQDKLQRLKIYPQFPSVKNGPIKNAKSRLN